MGRWKYECINSEVRRDRVAGKEHPIWYRRESMGNQLNYKSLLSSANYFTIITLPRPTCIKRLLPFKHFLFAQLWIWKVSGKRDMMYFMFYILWDIPFFPAIAGGSFIHKVPPSDLRVSSYADDIAVQNWNRKLIPFGWDVWDNNCGLCGSFSFQRFFNIHDGRHFIWIAHKRER